MSDSEYSIQSQVIGRPLGALMAIGQELDHRLGEASTPPPEPPRDTSPNVLSIPSVQFTPTVPVPFSFDGYPLLTAEDARRRRISLPDRGPNRLDLTTTDQAYIAETADLMKHYRGEMRPNAFRRFSWAIPDDEGESIVAKVWRFLGEMTEDGGSQRPAFSNLLAAARKSLEKSFQNVVRRTIDRESVQHDRGMVMDATHLYVAYVRVQIDNEVFARPHVPIGSEMSVQGWRILYTAMRSGDYKAAPEIAKQLQFPPDLTVHEPEHVLNSWMNTSGRMELSLIGDMMTFCETFMNQSPRISINHHYMIRTLSFLCGCTDMMDSLMTRTGAEWDSIDEFLWFMLGCVRYIPDFNADWIFDLSRLQERVNRYSETFYSEEGRKPMRYITALLCSLQFKKALKFMLKLEDRQTWFVHGVHIAVGLTYMGMLDQGGQQDEAHFSRSQIAQVVDKYATVFHEVDDQSYFQYRFFVKMLSAKGDLGLERAMLDNIMEQITRDKRPGVQLSDRVSGMIDTFANHHPLNRKKLLFDIGNSLRDKGHLEHAYKCYVAGDYLKEGLHTINQLITSKLSDMLAEKLMGHGEYFIGNRNHVAVLFDQFHAAYAGISNNSHLHLSEIRAVFKESTQLSSVFNMLESFHGGNYGDVMFRFENLSYIPKDENEMTACMDAIKNEFPLILSMLHKLFGIFCQALIAEAGSQPRDRKEHWEARIVEYQKFIMFFPASYSFKAQISQDLAQASSRLAAV